MSGVGWGSGAWGSSSWGGSLPGVIGVHTALAARENLIQLELSEEPYFTNLFDQHDAADPNKYTVNVVPGTKGLDDEPVWPVRVIYVEQTPEVRDGGRQFLDLYIDRQMTAWPAVYEVTVAGIKSKDLARNLSPAYDTAQVVAVHQEIIRPSLDPLVKTRDFANPQTYSAMLDPLPNPSAELLGTFPVDDSGDYAYDEGITSYKKRILRRIFSRPSSFAHMRSGYGVGIHTYGKKLALAATRAKIATDIEAQIQQEPETLSVSVRIVTDARHPDLTRFVVDAVMRTGQSVHVETAVPT